MSDESELSNFVKDVMDSLQSAENNTNAIIYPKIDFEVAVTTIKEAGGKFKLIVAEAGGKYEKETLSKVKFTVVKRPASKAINK